MELLTIDFLILHSNNGVIKMKNSEYFSFIELNGRSLSEINPGSEEVALNADDALQAIEILKKNSTTPVLGGDVLTNNNKELIYAYQFWGNEYHCLNWYCEKKDDESIEEYINRSYITAKDCINKANETAKNLGTKCYIALVV